VGVANRQRSRAMPRYRFSDKDKEIIRFINSKQSRIMSTVIIDISETGIGFLTSIRLAPHIGEIIKMDFAPMGSMRMACQGRVIHMESPPNNTGWGRFPGTVKVGVQFHDLPKEYRRILHDVLKKAFDASGRAVNEYSDVPVRREKGWIRQNLWSLFMTFLILSGVGYGIYRYATLDLDDSETTQEPTWASSFFERTIHK
jgi:hypothetical protein